MYILFIFIVHYMCRGIIMCYVTATELKNNLSHYLELSKKENVFITKNNKVISVLSNPTNNATLEAIMYVESLDIPKDLPSNDKLLEEEILKRCTF